MSEMEKTISSPERTMFQVKLKPASQRVLGLSPSPTQEQSGSASFGQSLLKPIARKDSLLSLKSLSIVVGDDVLSEFIATQQAVRDWIEEVLNVPLDKENLMDCLRSGVVLCYLMLELDPGSIPKIQENTTQVFKLKENVDFFLHAAQDLGVRRQKLFMVSDLFEGNNTVAVVDCLAELATRVLGRNNFNIPLRMDQYLADPLPLLSKLTIEEMDTLKIQIARRRTVSPCPVKGNIPSKIDKNVDSLKLAKGVARFQAVWRGFKVRKDYKAIKRKMAFRERIVRELLSTEKAYVDNVNTLISVYFTPLDEAAKSLKTEIIATDEVKSIFSAVLLIIRNFNSKMLAELDNRIDKSKNWGPNGRVGDILLKNINQEFLKIYTKYVQNFDSALRVVDQLRRENPKMAAFLREKGKDPLLKGLDLGAYLIQPVQRIPRYNMLLKELVKYTWANHPDADDIAQAEQIVAKVAETINEKKREAEQLASILPVAASIINSPVYIAESHRRFLSQAVTADLRHQVFLFSDILVIARPVIRDERAGEIKKKEKEKKRGSFLGGLLNSDKKKAPQSPSPTLKRTRSSSSNVSLGHFGVELSYEYLEHIPTSDIEAEENSIAYETEISCSLKKLSGVLPAVLTFSDQEGQSQFTKGLQAAKRGDLGVVASFNSLSDLIRSPNKVPSITIQNSPTPPERQSGSPPRIQELKEGLLSCGRTTEQILQERRLTKKANSLKVFMF